MGLAIGCGYYTLGWQLFLLIVAAQFLLRWIANGIDRRSGFSPLGATYQVAVAFDPSAAQMVDQSWHPLSIEQGFPVLECRKFSLAGSNSNLVASLYLSEQRAKKRTQCLHQARRETHRRNEH